MSQTISIDAPAGPAEAYLATPEHADGPVPGVLLYVDAIGLRPQIEEMADRIASWGYVVLAPHVFYRDGSAADLAPQGDLREPEARDAFFSGGAMARIGALTPDKTAADAEAWVATLQEHAGDGPLGTIGFCMGARLAVRTAGQFPGTVGAVGGFHGGGLVTEDLDSPHMAISGSTAEYVFGHADQDGSMPIEAVQALEVSLQEAGLTHLNEIYETAPHGYSMADTSMYQAEAATRMWAEMQSLFERAL